MSEEDGAYWSATIGNTLLANPERRPKGIDSWNDFKSQLLVYATKTEWRETLAKSVVWDAEAIEKMGRKVAEKAGALWYD